MKEQIKKRERELDQRVAVNLRRRRLQLGLRQSDVADILPITLPQYRKMESGSNRIPPGRLYILSKFLDVEIDFFFN